MRTSDGSRFFGNFDRVSLNITKAGMHDSRAMQRFGMEEHAKEIYEAFSE
jgi:hypothetical protein